MGKKQIKVVADVIPLTSESSSIDYRPLRLGHQCSVGPRKSPWADVS